MARAGQGSSARQGFGGGLVTGTALGLVWTPCVGPIMASVISLSVSRQVDGGAVLLLLAYTLGTAIPMTALMLGGRKLLQRFPALKTSSGKIQRVFGVLMIAVGLMLAFGLDLKFQSLVLQKFPGYGSGLTVFEQSDVVQNALEDRQGDAPVSEEGTFIYSRDLQPRRGRLQDLGQAPPLTALGPWLNRDQLPEELQEGPITMDDLKGYVVLIDFWTYSCVNCIRTLPYLRSWHDTYKDEGLIIIGVHSPEFTFERSTANVEKAMKDLGVNWPVVLDNGFQQWRSYGNRFWPAHYFIDHQGRVRYFHIGEGEYDTSEKVIRQLLQEKGTAPQERAEIPREAKNASETPETYLGYKRMEHFLSIEDLHRGESHNYSIEKSPENPQWGLEGQWIIEGEYITPEDQGILEIGFHGKKVFLVVESIGEGGSIQVELDGKTPADTIDVKSGSFRPEASRLYELVDLEKADDHLLRLRVEGLVRLYAFTFG